MKAPNFICIGQKRAGTQWLYDQLAWHPDFWMTPFKELGYFVRRFPRDKFIEAIGTFKSYPEEHDRRRIRRQFRPTDERDREFYDRVLEHIGQEATAERYAGLFASKGDLLSGDISPDYSSLSDDTVRYVADSLPDVKILLILRDPVQRLLSQANMWVGKNRVRKQVLSDTAEFRMLIERDAFKSSAFPSQIAERWAAHFDRRMVPYFFDDLEADPAGVRSRIISFIGGDPNKPSGELPPGFNRKSKRQKYSVSDGVRSYLVNYFEDELRACAAMFGSHARKWLACHCA